MSDDPEQVMVMSPATYAALPDAPGRDMLPEGIAVVLDATFPYGRVLVCDKEWWEHGRHEPPPAELQAIRDQIDAMQP